jgi:hypothetical protein
MRNSFKIVAVAFLVAMVAVPMQASAFWSGPGCMLASMLGVGSVSGGIGFSAGGGGYGSSHGPGYGYGYGYAFVYPYPYGHSPVYGTPYPGNYVAPMLPYGPQPPAVPFR